MKEDFIVSAPMNLVRPKSSLLKFLLLRGLCIPSKGMNAFSVKSGVLAKVLNKEKRDEGRQFLREDLVETI